MLYKTIIRHTTFALMLCILFCLSLACVRSRF